MSVSEMDNPEIAALFDNFGKFHEFIKFREECITIRYGSVDDGEEEIGAPWQGEAVDLFTAAHIGALMGFIAVNAFKNGLPGGEGFDGVGKAGRVGCENPCGAPGQRPSDGLEGLSAHDEYAAHGFLPEPSEILGQMPWD